MKKIPTIFQRDWYGDRSQVVDIQNPDCAWVFAGEGRATIKLDGTCVMVRDGIRYKRREIKDGTVILPTGFEECDRDETTGKIIGWVPVGDGPEDRWHREAIGGDIDRTYELIGPKIQGNVEKMFLGANRHELVPHGLLVPREEPPRKFDLLRLWLADKDIEGLVFHNPDGRMGKIKLRDFGISRKANNDKALEIR